MSAARRRRENFEILRLENTILHSFLSILQQKTYPSKVKILKIFGLRPKKWLNSPPCFSKWSNKGGIYSRGGEFIQRYQLIRLYLQTPNIYQTRSTEVWALLIEALGLDLSLFTNAGTLSFLFTQERRHRLPTSLFHWLRSILMQAAPKCCGPRQPHELLYHPQTGCSHRARHLDGLSRCRRAHHENQLGIIGRFERLPGFHFAHSPAQYRSFQAISEYWHRFYLKWSLCWPDWGRFWCRNPDWKFDWFKFDCTTTFCRPANTLYITGIFKTFLKN